MIYHIFVNISLRNISRNILGTNFCSRQPPKKKLTTDNLGERQELDKVSFLDLYECYSACDQHQDYRVDSNAVSIYVYDAVSDLMHN